MAPALQYATFWLRLGAGAIDFGLNLVATLAIGLLASQSKSLALMLMPALWLAAAVYEPVLHAKFGATLGKYVLGIRVVNLCGQPIKWSAAVLRSAISIALSAYWIYCTGSALFNLPSQEFHGQGWSDLFQTLRHDFPPHYEQFEPYLGIWFWSEFATMLLNPRRRAIHDYMAGTVVIVRSAKTPNPSVEPTNCSKLQSAAHLER